MKKILSIVLSVVMIFTMLPTFAITAFADRVITPEMNSTNDVWLTKDGVLHWTATTGTSNYTIRLYPHPSNSVIKTITVASPATTYNLIDALDSERYEQRDYRVEINNHGALLFTYASPFEKLTAPTDLKWDGDVAIWEPVVNAEKYGVYIYDSAGKYVNHLTTKDCFLNLAEYAPQDGWSFDVYASGKGYRDSAMNESPRKNGGKMIITPETNSSNDVWLTKDGVLHWTSGGSSKTTIQLFQHPSNSVLKTITLDSYVTEYNLFATLDSEKYEQRDYRVEVSKHTPLLITYVSPFEKLPAPRNLFWSGKVALWNPVADAEKYGVYIYDSAGKYVNHLTTKDCFLNLAEYAPQDGWSFCVYAVGKGYRDSAMNESPRKAGKISTVSLNGTIRPGNALSDNGPLTVSNDGIAISSFVYTKNGKLLSSNTKATYGNYGCTVNLFADEDHYFTNSTVLNFNGESYKPTNVMNNGEIAIFEIPNIYVECSHALSHWSYDANSHWLICPTCNSKYASGDHVFEKTVSGKTVTLTCTECGFYKTSSVPETRTKAYLSVIDLGTALVGDKVPTTAKADYAYISSLDSTKYYDYADVQSVKYSTTGTFKNEKTTVTVVLKAKNNYYFDNTSIASAAYQFVRESKTASADGTTLTVVFSFTPYTPANVTLTLPAEFTAGKTYAEIAKEAQFKVNGVVAKDYSVSIRKAGESSWKISNISDGVVSGQYMYESVIEPNTQYEFGVNSDVNKAYPKSFTITNPNVAVVTDSYYGEYGCRASANYTSTGAHNYDAGTVTKQANCTEDGVITFKCTDPGCNKVKTVVIPKKGHEESSVSEIPATCVENGKTAGKVCIKCSAVLSGCTIIAAKGHNYTTTTSLTKATTSKNGKYVKKCTCGALKTTTIYYPKTITLSTTKYVYNGTVRKPAVTVKGADGKTISASNYTVTYPSGRKNVGKYTYKITFKGNYSGSVSKAFTIVPKATSISSLSASSKGFTVKYKKQATQTTGYQIQYSTSSKFTSPKTVTVTKNSTVSKKVTKLTGKKKYYVRVRTYKKTSSGNLYSAWSASKYVTTKK